MMDALDIAEAAKVSEIISISIGQRFGRRVSRLVMNLVDATYKARNAGSLLPQWAK